MIINDQIKCLCLNSSYTGKYCETITKLRPFTATVSPLTPTTAATTRILVTSENRDDDNGVMITAASNRHATFEPQAHMTTSMPRLEDLPFVKLPTTRVYFWQCPNNCFYNLGHGFCALSNSGYPHCMCHVGWTGIDCSQRNYCVDNDCTNNSTCVNYPETK